MPSFFYAGVGQCPGDFVFLPLCSILIDPSCPKHAHYKQAYSDARVLLMKNTLSLSLLSVLLLGGSQGAWAQQIYRCAGVGGGAPEYINNVKDAQVRNCKQVSGGNVTVVQGTPIPKAPARVATSQASGGPRIDSGPEQRSRDSDSRGILESELRRSETRLAELQKEYNNGEPEKQGIEGRNYQRYLDRVNDLKDAIARTQSDVAGLKREISRLPTAN
jgi:hypothetical protein